MKKLHKNMAAIALLVTQRMLLVQAERMPKSNHELWLHAAMTPIRMMHYALNPKVINVAERIGKARIERFVRNHQGRRLPA
jgi:hypothetical protein